MSSSDLALVQILARLDALQVAQQTMQAKVTLQLLRLHNQLIPIQLDSLTSQDKAPMSPLEPKAVLLPASPPHRIQPPIAQGSPLPPALATLPVSMQGPVSDKEREKVLYPGRVNLTSTFFLSDLSLGTIAHVFRSLP